MINPLIPLIMSIIKIIDVLKRFTLLQLNFLDAVFMAANAPTKGMFQLFNH
jgi:hypothetical protein